MCSQQQKELKVKRETETETKPDVSLLHYSNKPLDLRLRLSVLRPQTLSPSQLSALRPHARSVSASVTQTSQAENRETALILLILDRDCAFSLSFSLSLSLSDECFALRVPGDGARLPTAECPPWATPAVIQTCAPPSPALSLWLPSAGARVRGAPSSPPRSWGPAPAPSSSRPRLLPNC